MTFTEDLQTRKNDARQEYNKACADWMETRTTDNINGNFEKWKIVCDKKRDCMRLGVIIQARSALSGFDSPTCFYPIGNKNDMEDKK